MIVLWFGSGNVFDEIISVGTLYIFSNYIRSFFDPIQELAEQFSTLQSSIASAEKIFTVMDEDESVSYTHLDVYKRQQRNSTPESSLTSVLPQR